MNTYIFIVVLLILTAIFTSFYFRVMYFSAKAVMQFRDLRHEATIYLSDNVKANLTIEDAERYRELIITLTNNLNGFSELRQHMPKVQFMKMFLSNLLKADNNLDILRPSKLKVSDKKFISFLDMYSDAYKTACKSIPLLRVRVILLVLKILFFILIILGFRRMKKYSDAIDYALRKESNSRNHNLYVDC